MPRQMPPVVHPGVRAGLTQIRLLRRVFISLVFGWPVVVLLAFEAGAPVFLFLYGGGGLVMWQALWWTRCPRCEEFFFSRVVFFFFAVISMFRRCCCSCGLDIRQLKR